MHQAMCLVQMYLAYGIEPLTLLYEITAKLRVVPSDSSLKWLYLNAIKIALEDECETTRKSGWKYANP